MTVDDINGIATVRSGSAGGFAQFGADAQWFRDLLASKGVTVIGGSEMDRVLDAMSRISDAARPAPVPEHATQKVDQLLQNETWRSNLARMLLNGVGGANLVRTIRKALAADRAVFDGNWDLFRGPDVVMARYLKRTRERDLTWELFVAALCVHAANDVRVARDENPDVRCRIRDVRWGVECKVFESFRRGKQIERVKEGIRQLQDSTAVDRGVVAVNLTSVVDHSRFDESLRAFGSPLFTEDDVMTDLKRQVEEFVSPFTQAEFHRWTENYQKARALFFHANTICLAGKTVLLTTFRSWVDLRPPEPADLERLLHWPHPLDQAMSNRFKSAADKL